jgi:hypothetical protein
MMRSFPKRNRKKGDPPGFPAWIFALVIIIFVILGVLLSVSRTTQTSDSLQVVAPSPDTLDLTGTYIIDRATSIAQGTPPPLDSFSLTATFVVGQATSIAQGTPQSVQPASNGRD